MEKKIKKVTLVIAILAAILLSLIAFLGMYKNVNGIWKNVLPEFQYGMEFGELQELRFTLDTKEEEKEIYLDSEGNYAGDVVKEETTQPEISLENPETGETEELPQEKLPKTEEKEDETLKDYKIEKRKIKTNPEESLTKENFNKTKAIIQKRLEALSKSEYNIRMNEEETGEIVIEVPNDRSYAEMVLTLVTTPGKVVMTDSETGLILLDEKNVSKVALASNTTENGGYQGYLKIELDKNGAKKLREEISQKYIKYTDENGDEQTKATSIAIDGVKLIELYFDPEMPLNNTITIPFGQEFATYEEFDAFMQEAVKTESIINSGTLPLKYSYSTGLVLQSKITENIKTIAMISFAAAVLVVSIVLIIKYKFNGFRQAIMAIGYIALLSLAIRFTHIEITINTILTFISVVVINYIFNFMLLNKIKNGANAEEALGATLKELYLTIIPLCIIAIIFSFMTSVVISSIGTTLFWGLILQALFSTLILI